MYSFSESLFEFCSFGVEEREIFLKKKGYYLAAIENLKDISVLGLQLSFFEHVAQGGSQKTTNAVVLGEERVEHIHHCHILALFVLTARDDCVELLVELLG